MRVVHVIEPSDVGDGVYRHPLRHPMRKLLVEIANKFGGIGPSDVGKRVYRAMNGELVWQGSHPEAL